MKFYRTRAENQVLQIQGQEEADHQPEVTPPRGAEGSSPTTSTPRDNGSQGAIRKNTYWNRNKSVSGLFSPIRGDVSAPAGTFYNLNRSRTEQDLFGRFRDEDNPVKDEEEAEEEEDDNHKTAEQTNAATKGSDDMVMSLGPSVIEQTREESETKAKKIKREVEDEQEEEDRHEEEEPGEGQVTRSRRKLLRPKRLPKK